MTRLIGLDKLCLDLERGPLKALNNHLLKVGGFKITD